MVVSSSAGEKIIYPDFKLEPMSSSERVKKTLKILGILGGATIFAIFIPVAHFVLVPVGLIVTVLMTVRTYKQVYTIKNFEVACPNCNKKSNVEVSGPDLPLRTFCDHCRFMIYLNN